MQEPSVMIADLWATKPLHCVVGVFLW